MNPLARISIALLLGAALTTPVALTAQTGWTRHEVGQGVTVDFPGTPEQTAQSPITIFVVQDTSGSFSVTAIDMKKQDPDFRIAADELEEYYVGVVSGIQKQVGAPVDKQENFRIGDYLGVDVEYTIAEGEHPGRRAIRILLIGRNQYSLAFSGNGSDADAVLQQRFFESLQVAAAAVPPTPVAPDQETLSPREVGFRIGTVIGYVIGIGIIVGVILLIIRLLTKKKR